MKKNTEGSSVQESLKNSLNSEPSLQNLSLPRPLWSREFCAAGCDCLTVSGSPPLSRVKRCLGVCCATSVHLVSWLGKLILFPAQSLLFSRLSLRVTLNENPPEWPKWEFFGLVDEPSWQFPVSVQLMRIGLAVNKLFTELNVFWSLFFEGCWCFVHCTNGHQKVKLMSGCSTSGHIRSWWSPKGQQTNL